MKQTPGIDRQLSWRIRCCAQSVTITLLLMVAVIVGCSTSDSIKPFRVVASDDVYLSTGLTWTLARLDNASHTHTASETASALLETHLRASGIDKLDQSREQSRYEVRGNIFRWHYAGALGLVPEVSLRLSVFDLHSDTLVWSDSVAGEGRRRESLTTLADKLIATLVKKMPLSERYLPDAQELMAQASMGSQHKQSPVDQATTLSASLALQTLPKGFAAQTIRADKPLMGRSTAFFYAKNPPVNILSQFDRLILESDNVQLDELVQLQAQGAATFAYLSIGEVGPDRGYAKDIRPEWVLGKNPAWSSQVLDLANVDLQNFLIRRVGTLRDRGFQGIFLDTMDSFNLVTHSDEDRARQQSALVGLIKRIAQQFPKLRIITNRGFEVVDQISKQIEAVAAESLYASWNNTTQRYGTVVEADRQWLLSKLDHVKNTLKLDVIAIDYVPAHDSDKARAVARKIAQHGYIPWVARPELDNIGVGALEVVPREVLMVYDSRVDGPIEISALHRFVATPLEYMGYVPVYVDRASDSLPTGVLKGRYAGVATWPARTYDDAPLHAWLQQQLDDTLPVALFAIPPVGLDRTMAESLGISVSNALDLDSAVISYMGAMVQPELTIPQRIDSMGLIANSVATSNTAHLSYRDKSGNTADVVVTGPFGGFAWRPGDVIDGLDSESYWMIDPYQFLREALQLPDVPMPDVTSENGKRLWLAHIDGDALPSWAEMPGKQLGAEVIFDRILTRYPLPHTVSVVEAEMTENVPLDSRHKRMFDIARKTFSLEHVELASHTYSHPFKWKKLAKHRQSGKYNLPVRGYEYSAEREVAGSIKFIDDKLAPAGKRTAVMLWSGDALPQAQDLASADRLGIPNMNGGVTHITRDKPSLTLVSPMARPVGKHLQVYAPIMNENMYTNDWSGPFDGFRQVIETFEMTEYPRRLKPLNIYYHFYSGTKIASMKALDDVYQWSLAQDIYPLFVSEYTQKVADFRKVGVARYLDGRWKLTRLGQLRSLRMINAQAWPELRGSQGLSGAQTLHDGVYMHTDGSQSVTFNTTNQPPRNIHLVSSNGRVATWQNNGAALSFRIMGHVPVVVELGGAISSGCTIDVNKHQIRGSKTDNDTLIFTFTTQDTGHAILNCQA